MNRNQLILACIIFLTIDVAFKSEATPQKRKHESRIIGGQEAYVGQFPFAAAIHVETSDGNYFCGGALTGNDWVITAGHCVYNAKLCTIQLGSNYLDRDEPGKLTIATSTYILHPDFNPLTIENDIAIIKFRKPVDYNVYLNPVFPMDNDLQDYASVYALGWGQTSDTKDELSNELRFLLISTISNSECRMVYGDQVKDNMVCAIGNLNEGTCIGDNGGPLVAGSGKYYGLVAVASFISGNGCESTNPSGYTRTYPYLNWIRNITQQTEF